MLFNILNRKNISFMTDQDLLKSYQQKKRASIISEIYKRYSMMMYGVSLKYLKNQFDAEDCLMSTFEKLPSKITKSEVLNLKNWLYTIIKNECLMQLRKKNKELGDIEHTLLLKADDSETQKESILLKEMQLNLLEAAIKDLKPEQQDCVELFYLKKLSYDEVAIKTGFEIKKVKSYIQNGKRNLKLILEQNNVFK